jgi:plasmid stabilization system protein ParE
MAFRRSLKELPEKAKRQAVHAITLLSTFPHLYPMRCRGLMQGYRYFIAGRFLFYYSVAGQEVRVSAIIPAAMKMA